MGRWCISRWRAGQEGGQRIHGERAWAVLPRGSHDVVVACEARHLGSVGYRVRAIRSRPWPLRGKWGVQVGAREDVVTFWDEVIDAFLHGSVDRRPPLDRWMRAYQGKGRGHVVLDAFPEPYLGRLDTGQPRAVILGLNPGQAFPDLQAVDGQFAHEIRAIGSYHAWAATAPYFGSTWLSARGRRNLYHEARLRFLRRFFEEPELSPPDMLVFELYPWHSTAVTSSIRPDPDIVSRFIWEPIAELGNPIIFAFGAPWLHLIRRMELPVLAVLGAGGTDYGSAISSRTVVIARTPRGGVLVAEKHTGGAGPPSLAEIPLLRTALSRWMDSLESGR